MFLKPVNSDMENGFQKISKMSPAKIHIQRKLEKTLFERHQNTKAMGVDYLTLKKNNLIQFFYFKTFHFLKKKKMQIFDVPPKKLFGYALCSLDFEKKDKWL